MLHHDIAADVIVPTVYWEARAQRYAKQQRGLPAVCSYGMPAFYNCYIDWLQRRALHPWLQRMRGARVLDVGCGVGRWSIELARNGAHVTGVDISATMIDEASRQARAAGVADRCRFFQADLTEWRGEEPFDYILGVTVLQHILDNVKFAATIAALSKALHPGGQLVLLEVAPTAVTTRCDSQVFTSRSLADWHTALSAADLQINHIGSVDPAPFKTLLLPHFRSLPRAIANVAMAGALAISAPLDFALADLLVHRSWHKVIVATPANASSS